MAYLYLLEINIYWLLCIILNYMLINTPTPNNCPHFKIRFSGVSLTVLKSRLYGKEKINLNNSSDILASRSVR